MAGAGVGEIRYKRRAMFQSLEIQNFRGFGKFALGELGRINLIVGKNNTGKTSLLEAITLLANPGIMGQLPGLFRANAGSVGDRFFRWLPKDGANGGEAVLAATTPAAESKAGDS